MGEWLRRVVLAALAVEYVPADVDLTGAELTVDPEARKPIFCLHCAADEMDAVEVSFVEERGVVLITAKREETPFFGVVAYPQYARAFAAAILNAADSVDGTAPLMFMPTGSGEEQQ